MTMRNWQRFGLVFNYFRSAVIVALTIVVFSLVSELHASTPISEKTIAGTWACASLTALENGKQSGTVKFNPGNITFTFAEDGTWQMETNLTKTHEKTRIKGNLILHENELVLKYPDGKTYKDFHLDLKDDGKTLVMTDDGEIISASKLT
jgi:hypothetical protein